MVMMGSGGAVRSVVGLPTNSRLAFGFGPLAPCSVDKSANKCEFSEYSAHFLAVHDGWLAAGLDPNPRPEFSSSVIERCGS